MFIEHGGARHEPRPIDVFAPDGEYTGTLPAGSPFPILFLPDDRFAAAETDEMDVTRLVVFDIVPQ